MTRTTAISNEVVSSRWMKVACIDSNVQESTLVRTLANSVSHSNRGPVPATAEAGRLSDCTQVNNNRPVRDGLYRTRVSLMARA